MVLGQREKGEFKTEIVIKLVMKTEIEIEL
jgi:hypothetical protein